MRCRLFPALLALGLLFSVAAAQEDKSYSADRFDVAVTIEEGGSLLVRETIRFRFVGGPFTFVFRELPLDHTDGISNITATVDGRPLPPGSDPGQVEIRGRDPVRVTWHLEPTSDVQRAFELSYRVWGVVRQEDDADLLKWQVLPDDYAYTIGSSRVTFAYQPTAELLAPPTVLAGTAAVSREPGLVIFQAQDLGANDPLVVSLTFQPGSLIVSPPAWQAEQIQRNRYGPWWVVAAGALFAAGLAGIAALMRPYRRKSRQSSGIAYEPPGELPPAVAGALRTSGAKPDWSHALGTLFDLAGRGLLSIDELPDKKWYQSRDFLVRQIARPSNLRPHEQGLLDMIFLTKSGSRLDEVKLSRLNRLITSARWKGYSETLQAELKAAGLVSPARQKVGKRMISLALALALVSVVVTLPLVVVFRSPFGLWPLAMVGALFLLASVWLSSAARLSFLSDEGAALAGEWERFYRHLHEVTRGKATVSHPDAFERYLPYAAAYGLLEAWAKRFEKQGWSQTPPYFHALSTAGDGSMAAFVAMSSASSSSGGAGATAGGAGAAGAGAAGGGASGAG